MDLLSHLLPLGTGLRVADLAIDAEHTTITVDLHAIADACPCPVCHQPMARIHSHYQRTMADLPWADLVVRLRLSVRKFFCDNAACIRKIFTERLPTLVAPSARRSLRLIQQQQQLGLALGGNPSARLSSTLGYRASRNTFLRLVQRIPLPEPAPPEVVGIDDWAWKKGQRYGTIITDLVRRCPLALLCNRDADMLAAWLKQYPTIRVIARDRAGAYADGATRGAPQAIQVADRFHLLRNLADTLLPVFEHHAKVVRTAANASAVDPLAAAVSEVAPAPTVTEDIVRTLPPPTMSPKQQAQSTQRRTERVARYDAARALHRQGWPIRAIGRTLGLNRNTVRVYLRAETFPERQPRVLRQPGVLDPFIPYLIERWNAGCRNGTELWKAIDAQGYTGKRVTVFSFVTRLRKALGIPAKNRTLRHGTVAIPEEPPLTPRNAVWQVLQRPEQRDETTATRVTRLRQAHPDLEEGISLAEAFAVLVRGRDPTALDRWLEQAAASTLKPFRSFAASLRRDYAAVRAGVEHTWSTGPVEGEINRLKTVKRMMFGRAGFPLLQRRVLLC